MTLLAPPRAAGSCSAGLTRVACGRDDFPRKARHLMLDAFRRGTASAEPKAPLEHGALAAEGPVKPLLQIALVAILLALFGMPASAGTLSGTIINRTTGKPTPNVDLTLLSPTQGMIEVGSAKSDAQGRFSLTNDKIGLAPILVRATYHDVSFNTFAPPSRPEVEVEIFDISKDPKTISITSHIIIFQPQGERLVGAEEYEVQNNSQPPSAFFRSEGDFDFVIPENGALGQVTTIAGMGMSVAQASIDKGKGRFSIAYPFRPGQTNVRLSYELPYANNSAVLKLPASYPGVKLLVVVPPGVTITGDGLSAAGQEQGMMVYTHDPLPAKGLLAVNLSGVGAPAEESAQGQQSAQEGNSRTAGQEVIAAPSRIDEFKWYLFAGIAALFAMGAILLTRKQVVLADTPVAQGEPSSAAAFSSPQSKSARSAKSKKALSVPASTNAPGKAVAAGLQTRDVPNEVAAAVDEHVSVTLDALKDQLFRLELRRQAGTISEEDYAREKAKFDKLLREHL